MIEIIMLPEPFSFLTSFGPLRHVLARGEVLFHQDQPAEGPYFVQAGEVELVRHTRDGKQVTLFRGLVGDTIAEASLFSDCYHCDCICRSDSVLIGLNKALILREISRNPVFTNTLLKRMAGQIQGYRRRLEIMAILSAEERVLAALEEFGQPNTVMQFSQSIGLSHEACYRALSKLVKRGRVARIGRGKYRVL
ncbi:MAG: Crp/Fnr family transcriptional regulator [Marinosulfonomonas sp.]|nr:Crp/Fnr family transcriptional regulator [Marinosulfonomonas sp.]